MAGLGRRAGTGAGRLFSRAVFDRGRALEPGGPPDACRHFRACAWGGRRGDPAARRACHRRPVPQCDDSRCADRRRCRHAVWRRLCGLWYLRFHRHRRGLRPAGAGFACHRRALAAARAGARRSRPSGVAPDTALRLERRAASLGAVRLPRRRLARHARRVAPASMERGADACQCGPGALGTCLCSARDAFRSASGHLRAPRYDRGCRADLARPGGADRGAERDNANRCCQ